MYTQYFGFTDAPFSIAPNPQFLYMSPRHQEALAHLLYGVKSDGGFILLTGEVGTGKTTLCRCLLAQIPEDVETAYVLNPRVTAKQLMASICDEFGVAYPQTASLKRLVDNLNLHLLECHARHRRAVLIIDEAQNLSRDLLEQLRLLTNLETSERKLLQIILLGQPELLDMLAEDNLRQFSQRITARFHLGTLNKQETLAYIQHRLEVVGGLPDLFTRAAKSKVYSLSDGIPRVINLICDRALLGAYAQDRRQVDAKTVQKAAIEVLGQSRSMSQWGSYAGLVATSLLIAVTGFWLVNPNWPLVGEVITDTETTTPPLDTLPSTEPAISGHRQKQDAYHDLFALWGTAFDDRDINACALASRVGLECFELSASLEQLQNINRPAIVKIKDEYLTISRISETDITLIASANQVELSKETFARLYDGRASLLWRTPPAYAAPLSFTDQGEAVDWLVSRLSELDGETLPTDAGFIYNESIEDRVRQFQTSVGLDPSGIADPMTWIYLNTLNGESVPTLHEDQG